MLKQFLKILSEDPSITHRDELKPARPLMELLKFTGYSSWSGSINMAELVTLLLKKTGLGACSEEMMEYIINGGSVDEFMKRGT